MKHTKTIIILSLLVCFTACGKLPETDTSSNEEILATEIGSEDSDISCPFASFDNSAVRVTTAAYVPYLMNVNADSVKMLSDALINLSWDKISPDTEYIGGETQIVFVNNDADHFKLVFYADGVIDYEYNGIVEKYKVNDEKIYGLVYQISNPDNLGELFDTLIWCAPEYLTNEKVWDEHNYKHVVTIQSSKPTALGT